MDTLDRETLVALARPAGWPAVSVYLPMHRSPRETGEDRLRFKNLIRTAFDRLVAEGMRDPEAEAFLSPLREMHADDAFWRDTGDGLAVFASKDGITTLRLATWMPEQVVVGDRHYLRPLVAAHLKTEQPFYALALDKNGSRLFEGNLGEIRQIELPGAPTSEEDSAKYDEPTKLGVTAPFAARQKHGSPSGGGSTGQFPGHGSELNYEKDIMSGYVRQVDAALIRAIGTLADRPLVLLGTERVVAEYRLISNFTDIYERHVEGTTDYLSPQMIHERVLSALEPYFEQQTVRELASVTENEGTDLVTRDAETIVEAAAVGRVRMLFFDDGMGPFGTFDRDTMDARVECDVEPRLLRERGDMEAVHDGECGWDLIDLAIAETVLHDGEVHAFRGEDAPVHGAVALLRY